METFERTWGARLNNAGKLVTYLQSFNDYSPPTEEQSAANLQKMVDEITALNKLHSSNENRYSLTADSRAHLFRVGSDSVLRMLTPVLAAVRAGFGKQSKEVANLSAKAAKIRGIKLKKASAGDAKAVSQSQGSYGSVTKHFADIIAILEDLGSNYKPANKGVSIGSLNGKLVSMNQLNTEVSSAFANYKSACEERKELYNSLSTLSQHIKEAVKSQYGYQSKQYKLVKGLVI